VDCLWIVHYLVVRNAQQAGISRLFHYQRFDARDLEDTLERNRIHVSNIKNVNDPWDCRPYFEVDVSDPRQRQRWADRLRPLVEANVALQQKIARLQRPWDQDERFLELTIVSLMKHNHANNIELWRMYCLTPDPVSILMWAHYAKQHTGICLEFDTDQNLFGRALKVTYRKCLPVITADLFADQEALTETILLTKSDKWSYEDEYRLLPRDGRLDPTFSLTCYDDFLSLPPHALSAVIAGPNCADEHIKLVEGLIAKHAPHVAFKRAGCLPQGYALSIAPSVTPTARR
jgi:hypothetical protein